jgi:hypothetical protein
MKIEAPKIASTTSKLMLSIHSAGRYIFENAQINYIAGLAQSVN